MGPRCLGLTGGIGSGKSAALEAFRRLGAAVLSSDDVVHRCYEDPAVRDAVVARFGPSVRAVDGSIDRRRLGQLAFADPRGMRFLEALIHPRVGEARRSWRRAEAQRVPPAPLLVCEVPLLFEANLAGEFDAVLVVTASEAVRRRRVVERGQDFAARSGVQVSEEDKLARADRAFVNDGSLAELDAWVAGVFAEFAR